MIYNQEFGNGNVPRVKLIHSYDLSLIAPDILWRKPNLGSVLLNLQHCHAATSGVKRDGQARDIFIINYKGGK